MTNYRCISPLTVFPKVFKKAMHRRHSQHLHSTNLIVTEHNGFRKGISPENAAFRLADSGVPLNQNMHVGRLECDLPKVLIV